MSQNDLKHILISILIGAAVAFFTTLFQELANFFKQYSTNMIAGGATSFAYIVKHFRS